MLYIFITTDSPFKFSLDRIFLPDTKMVLICPSSFAQLSEESFANFFYNISFTDKFDLDSLALLVRQNMEKAGNHNPVILTADESVMMVTAQLRDYFGAPGYNSKVIRKFTNKAVMKDILKNHDIDLPKYVLYDGDLFKNNPEKYVENTTRLLGLPIFAKPINGSGSTDTTKIENDRSLLSWCKEHISATNFELDEFIDGTLYHCDSVILNGEIAISLACKEITPCFDFVTAGKMLCSTILPADHPDCLMLKEFNRKVLQALSPPENSVTHFEIFKTAEGRLIFLEIAARAPGAQIPQLYEKCFGWNIQEAYFKLQMGLEINISNNLGHYAANCIFPRQAGIVAARNKLPEITSNYEIYWDAEAGQNLGPPTDIGATSCSLVLWNRDYDNLCRDVDILDKWNPVTLL